MQASVSVGASPNLASYAAFLMEAPAPLPAYTRCGDWERLVRIKLFRNFDGRGSHAVSGRSKLASARKLEHWRLPMAATNYSWSVGIGEIMFGLIGNDRAIMQDNVTFRRVSEIRDNHASIHEVGVRPRCSIMNVFCANDPEPALVPHNDNPRSHGLLHMPRRRLNAGSRLSARPGDVARIRLRIRDSKMESMLEWWMNNDD